jgi:anti-anti-sigma factor
MDESEPFEITTVSHDAGGSVVRVRGELDLATCAELAGALAGTPAGQRVVVDLTACTFLDSAAIRVLLHGTSAAVERGGTLSLVATDPGVLRVLEIANVEARTPIHSTVEAAIVEQSG